MCGYIYGLVRVELYYKFQDFLLNMESKKCGKYTQFSVKKEFKIRHGSIVETILVDNQRIFYKNEDENNENPRERWFIKRQDTKESKQQYDSNELEKINNGKGESLDDGDFFEITKKKYSRIYTQTVKADKTTIGIPKLSWDTMNDFQKTEYKTLLKQKGITELLLLSPYEFAATNTSQRYKKRNQAKKENADAKLILETSKLPLQDQLRQQIPKLSTKFPGLSKNDFNNALRNALKFPTIKMATANFEANLKAIFENKSMKK